MRPAAGRYAPSPSGPLHLGNLRTALLAWLFARSTGAEFLLRIEDLDPERSHRRYAAQALEDLRRLGLDWDRAPLVQSERSERHREAFAELQAAGRTYPCWCTRAEVRLATTAPHGVQSAYPGTCRGLTGRERGKRERSGQPAAWRLDAQSASVAFVDRLRRTEPGVVDDFVLWRGEQPAYNLAVVVDDGDQGIGEVVRGDDLLQTTPRQTLLAELLGITPPRYAHVPLVLGADGQRLAKRHGAVTLADQLALGVSIEALVGWMGSSVGLCAPGSRLTTAELLSDFDPARLRLEPTLLSDGAIA